LQRRRRRTTTRRRKGCVWFSWWGEV